MSAGRKSPVIAVEILDHLGAFKSPRADTAGENDHPCQKRSKGGSRLRRAEKFHGGASRQLPISSREKLAAKYGFCLAARGCRELHFLTICGSAWPEALARRRRRRRA